MIHSRRYAHSTRTQLSIYIQLCSFLSLWWMLLGILPSLLMFLTIHSLLTLRHHHRHHPFLPPFHLRNLRNWWLPVSSHSMGTSSLTHLVLFQVPSSVFLTSIVTRRPSLHPWVTSCRFLWWWLPHRSFEPFNRFRLWWLCYCDSIPNIIQLCREEAHVAKPRFLPCDLSLWPSSLTLLFQSRGGGVTPDEHIRAGSSLTFSRVIAILSSTDCIIREADVPETIVAALSAL